MFKLPPVLRVAATLLLLLVAVPGWAQICRGMARHPERLGRLARRRPRVRVPNEAVPGVDFLMVEVAHRSEGRRPFRSSSAIFRLVGFPQRSAPVPAEIATNAGLSIDDTQEQTIKDELKANTSEAVERGVFGAPTFFVGEDMFFGNDRFDFIKEAIRYRG